MFELIDNDNFSLCPKVSLKDLLFRMRKQKKRTSGKSSQFNETFEKNCMLCGLAAGHVRPKFGTLESLSMQFFSKVSLNWELFPEVLFFCFLIRNNKSFKETFGQSEKLSLSINSNMNLFASYLSWIAFLQLSTQTPVKVLSNTVLPRLTGNI
jgi:hypothetical protein